MIAFNKHSIVTNYTKVNAFKYREVITERPQKIIWLVMELTFGT